MFNIATVTPPTRPRGRLAYALGVNYAAMISLAVAVNFMPVFLTALRVEFGNLSNEQLGRIGAVTFAGLVVGIAAVGPFVDRYGAKAFAVGGNLLVAAGLLAVGLCPNYPALLAAMFVMGLGAGILDTVLSPIVAALRPDNRTAAMNWLHSFYCAGAVLAVLAGVAAVKAGVGWRALALAMTPIPAVVGMAFGRLRVPPLVAGGGTPVRFRSLAIRPFFLVAVVAIFLAGATELGMAQWLPAYAEQTLGFSPAVGGLALVGFSVAMTLGRMVVGTLGRWFTAYTLMLAGCGGTVALFLVGCFAPWPEVAVVGCVAAGFTGSALWPSMLAVTADRYPNGGATMYGVLAALGNAGGIVMPWGVGVIADATTMRLGLASAAVCPLLMLGCLLWLRGRAAERVKP